MTAFEFLDALGDIEDGMISELYSRMYPGAKKVRNGFRRTLRVLIAAAAIISALGLTAYAISSLHQRRQEELRERYKVEENNISSFVEYPEPSVQPGVSLVSAISDGEFQTVYVNVFPISEEEAYDGTRNYRFNYSFDGGESFSAATVPLDESKLKEDDMITVYDEYSGLEFRALDPDKSAKKRMETSYDKESQTLTLCCNILKSRLAGMDEIELSLFRLPTLGVKHMEDEDIELYGSVHLNLTEAQLRKIVFSEPVVFDNTKINAQGTVVGIDLYPTGAEILIEFEDAEKYFSNHSKTDEEVAAQIAWINAMDAAVKTAKILFSDGTEKEIPGILSAPYENGYVSCYSGWNSTIDIDDIAALEIMGQRIELD